MKDMKENLSTLEPLLDLATAAAVLGCSVSTVIRMCMEGSLPYVAIHRGKRKLTRKIRPSSLSAFLADNTVRSTPGEGGNLPPLPITSVGADAQESATVD